MFLPVVTTVCYSVVHPIIVLLGDHVGFIQDGMGIFDGNYYLDGNF